jgi:hypothetical protein
MRAIREAGALALALAMATALTACQKKADTDISTATPEGNPARAEEAPATGAETPAMPTTSAPEPPPSQPKPPAKPAPKPGATQSPSAVPAAETHSVSLPSGTVFDVQIATPVNSGTSNVGDKIEATLVKPLAAPDGYVIANQGAVIRGEIAELKRASKSKSEEDRAMMRFAFTSIETVDGEKSLNATVTNSEEQKAGGTGKRDALVIGGSAVAGAIIGKIIGKDTKGAVIGAVSGAVLATGAMMASKGHELDIPAGTQIALRAEEPITIVAK